MAKRKLNNWMRQTLKRAAEKMVVPVEQKTVLDAAYKKAAPLVRKAVQKKYPPKDMKICLKYQAASIDDCIKVQYPNGGVQEFKFEHDTGPIVTQKTYHGQMYLIDQETAEAVEAWADATQAYKDEYKKRIAAYHALIDGANYLDDVLAVWEDAANLIPLNALPIALGPEQIALVKADVEERAGQ